jgi:hypothetical protein
VLQNTLPYTVGPRFSIGAEVRIRVTYDAIAEERFTESAHRKRRG